MYFLKITKTKKLLTAIAFIMGMVFSFTFILFMHAISHATDLMTAQGAEFSEAVIIVAGAVLLFIIALSINNFISLRLNLAIRKIIFNKFTAHYVNNTDDVSVSNAQNRYTQELQTLIDDYFSRYLDLSEVVFSFIFAVTYAILIQPFVVLLMLGIVIGSMLLNNLFSKRLASNMKNLQEENVYLNKIVAGVVPSAFDLNLYNSKSFGEKLLQESTDRNVKARYKNNGFLVFVNILNNVIGFSTQIGSILIVLYFFSIGRMTMGEIMAIMLVSQHIVSPLQRLLGIKNSIDSTKTIRTKFESLEIAEDTNAIQEISIKNIEFDNVIFSYPTTDENSINRNILNGINLSFEAGKKYLVLGHSGSGKSTLLRLLLKRFETNEGKLLINGTDIKEINKSSLYEKVAYIKQGVDLLPVDIYKNIALSDDYDTQKLDEILKSVNLDPNLFEKDVEVNENQDNFSGGEQQRIILARLFYHLDGKELLLFDEFTAALDLVNAYSIEKSMLSLENKTIINISHKFNKDLMEMYDKLLIISEGTIVYDGNTDLEEEKIVELLK
ncbi:MAG: ABC transporter ATP-binding protein/permease [Defluviitaleaceae bacterium]|nr:ABC transporter ATP-binding protein/permease [Defluviitaleaceae bacterium]